MFISRNRTIFCALFFFFLALAVWPLTPYELLLWLKVPASLFGYSRSLYGVYLFLVLLPLLYFLPKTNSNQLILSFALLSYTAFTFLMHLTLYDQYDIGLADRVYFLDESYVSAHSFDNTHITKATLGFLLSKLGISVLLPMGDTGLGYRGFFDQQTLWLLLGIQVLFAVLVVRAALSDRMYRLVSIPLAIGVIKHIFDGGFLSPSGVPLAILFCTLPSIRNSTQLITSRLIGSVFITLVLSCIFAVILAIYTFNAAVFENIVYQRLLFAVGLVAVAIIGYGLLLKQIKLLVIGLLALVMGILVNPVIHEDLIFAYREYLPGSKVQVFTSAPQKQVKDLYIHGATKGHEIYSHFGLRPGFNWIEELRPYCNKSQQILLELNKLVDIKTSPYFEAQLINCTNQEWCAVKVLIKTVGCLPSQSGFPEMALLAIDARQPTIIRGIIGHKAENCPFIKDND